MDSSITWYSFETPDAKDPSERFLVIRARGVLVRFVKYALDIHWSQPVSASDIVRVCDLILKDSPYFSDAHERWCKKHSIPKKSWSSVALYLREIPGCGLGSFPHVLRIVNTARRLEGLPALYTDDCESRMYQVI